MEKMKNIVILLNESKVRAETLTQTIRLARKHQLHVHFLKTVNSYAQISMLFKKSTANINKTLIAHMESEIEQAHPLMEGISHSCHIREGISFIETIREMARTRSDLLIIPEPEILPTYFENNTQHLIRKCPKPVWVVRKQYQHTPLKVLVMLDIEINNVVNHDNNEKCMKMARYLSESNETITDIAHAWSFPNEYYLREISSKISTGQINDMVEREFQYHQEWFYSYALKQHELHINSTNILNGEKSKITAELVKNNNIDLLILATVDDITNQGVFISNEAENIIQHVTCSVIGIKPNGFVTPVQTENGK